MKKLFLILASFVLGLSQLMADSTIAKRVANAESYIGTEPFIGDFLTGEIYALNNLGKYEKWGVLGTVDDLSTTTTYEGKLVILSSDNCEYKFVGGTWVNVGSVLPQEISTTANYKNMVNGQGWYCRFGYENTFSKFTYDAESNTNTINPYEGSAYWEPYQSYSIDGLNPGDTYRVSFKYTGTTWRSWSSYLKLPFYVANTPDFGRELYTEQPTNDILAVALLPNIETVNKEYTLQFVADKDFCVLAVQFGVLDDGAHVPAFAFTFADLKIERVPVVEQYVNNFEIVSYDDYSYTSLSYIESTEAARENVFTLPYTPVTATQIDTKFRVYDSSNGWCGIFCARDVHAGTGISLYMNGDKAHFGYFTGNTTGGGDNFAPFSVNTTYTVSANVQRLVVNDVDYWTGNSYTNPTTRNLSLFANPEWDNPMRGRIYYCTISENGETIYDFKPVIRHDGVFGFYDKASKLFLLPVQGNNYGYGFGTNSSKSYMYFTNEPRTIFVGFSEKYELTVLQMDPTLSWTSSDENIATVSDDGTVTGIAKGTVTITATDANSDWSASYVLNVEPAIVAVTNVETWDGQSDAILGSIMWSGDQYKSAYTVIFDSGTGYGDGGTTNPNFNVIVGVPEEDENNRAWYEADYEMTNVPTAIWSYNNTVLPDGWSSNPGDVYVRRYFKAEGELPEQLYMPAAHDDSPCEYYINGTLVWKRTGYEPGVNGWYEAEVVRLSAEQRALIKTDGSVNVFAYHVHQNWGGRYADGGIYGNSLADYTPSKEFESNELIKRLTNAVEQAEGVEGFPVDILEYLKNATVCIQDAEYALGVIHWELRKLLSPRHEFDFASEKPADGLECWLLNVGAGQFLAGGNDWGTHASLNYNISAWPMVLFTNSSGENRYSIKTNLPNGLRIDFDGLGHDGYVAGLYGDDFTTSEDWAWTFEPVGNGNYRIIQSGKTGDDIYLGMVEDDRYQVDPDRSDPDNPYNQWKIITRAQLEALAAIATPENPADVSYFIHQNAFSQNDFEGDDKAPANFRDDSDIPWQYSAWERNAGVVWNYKANYDDFVFEMYNTADRGKVYLKQTLVGLPVGQYIVECTGFYRDGSYEDAIAGNSRKLAYFYAGSESNCTPLPSILEGANLGAGYGRIGTSMIPDACNQAPRFFKLGTYTVQTPVVTVGNDGVLEIGIYRDAVGVKESDWIVVDNFRLYRVGQAVTISDAPYATYVAPVDVDFTGCEVKAFAAQEEETWIHLEPVTTVPAGTAVVVKAEAPGAYAVNSTTGASLGTDNVLIAATTDVMANGTQYVLAKWNGVPAFYMANPGTYIPKGKGYLVPSAPVKDFYGFDFDDATEIKDIDVAEENAPIYNISGQRISKKQKGINIVGGKKILK